MLLVGVINMATALLALILERSRMIGLLKALGANNTLVQKIFLYSFLSSMNLENFLILFVFHEYVLYLLYLYLIFKVTKQMDEVVK